MINETSIQAVNNSRLNDHFGKPLYGSYCFSQIPATITHLLTGEGPSGLPQDVLPDLRRYEKVVLLFVDAFGWRFFNERKDQLPFLSRFVSEGKVSKLTSQFPSTTAAHVTTIHTGLSVGESGVFEWYYYDPIVDQIITPLPFSFAQDHERETLLKAGFSAKTLFPFTTIHQYLAARGIKPYIFQHHSIAFSSYSDITFQGAAVSPYRTLSEGLINLTQAIKAESGPAYFFMYIDTLDTICHLYGPQSSQFHAEVTTVMTTLEQQLHNVLQDNTHNTLLLITADHGQTQISPETTVYLNQLSPSVAPFMRRNKQGQMLVPAGSPRDMFLYIKDEHLAEAYAQLQEHLNGIAEVYYTQQLIDAGFFCAGTPSERFLSRVGNIVILPYAGQGVWWYEKGKFEQRFYGHHGGLVRDEMETFLLALPYD